MSEDVKELFITYVGVINSNSVKNIMVAINNVLSQKRISKINFLLSSPGGEVFSGITLHNFIKSLDYPTCMYNIGSVDSIATVVFLAGEERYAYPHASFLFHGIKTNFQNNSSLTFHEMKERMSSLEGDQSRITNLLTDNSMLTRKELDKMYITGESKGADFAQDKGIIQNVRSVKIPKSAVSIVFN